MEGRSPEKKDRSPDTAPLEVGEAHVDLSEIEACLGGHADVSDAVVAVHEGEAGDKQLVAHVAVIDNAELSSESLQRFLKERLPEHMAPTAFLFHEKLPRMETGEPDWDTLSAPLMERPDLAVDYEAPSTELEEQLAQIWSDVLKVSEVGVNDNFLDLGGNSMSTVKIISRIKEEMGVELSIFRLLLAPTVARLAKTVEEEKRT